MMPRAMQMVLVRQHSSCLWCDIVLDLAYGFFAAIIFFKNIFQFCGDFLHPRPLA